MTRPLSEMWFAASLAQGRSISEYVLEADTPYGPHRYTIHPVETSDYSTRMERSRVVPVQFEIEVHARTRIGELHAVDGDPSTTAQVLSHLLAGIQFGMRLHFERDIMRNRVAVFFDLQLSRTVVYRITYEAYVPDLSPGTNFETMAMQSIYSELQEATALWPINDREEMWGARLTRFFGGRNPSITGIQTQIPGSCIEQIIRRPPVLYNPRAIEPIALKAETVDKGEPPSAPPVQRHIRRKML